MNQEQEQALLAQLATFLKTYKLIFATKLNLFHTILTHQDTKPLSCKILSSHTQYIHSYPQHIELTDEKIKIIQRFCLRITQFLQYRLCLLKSLKLQWLITEISVFENGLKKLFNQIKIFDNLCVMVKKIVQYRNSFAKRILTKISQKNLVNIEQFQEINDLFQQILLKNIEEKNDNHNEKHIKSANLTIKTIQIGQKSRQLVEVSNIQDSPLFIKKKQCFKISQRSNFNNRSTRFNGNQNWEQTTLRNKTDNTEKQKGTEKRKETEQSCHEKQSKKSKGQQYMEDLRKILSLQTIPKMHSQHIIRKELIQLNKKNNNMINKFIKRCNQKQRKAQTKKSLQINKKQNSDHKHQINSEKAITDYRTYKINNQRKVLKLSKPITIMNHSKPNVHLNRYPVITSREDGLPTIQKRIIQILGI